jgi:flagellar basal body-associated protein FliL
MKEPHMDEQERAYLLQQVRQGERSNRRWKLATITLAVALAVFLIAGGMSSLMFGMRLQRNMMQIEQARAAEAEARLQAERALRQRADEKAAEKKKASGI